MWYVSCMHVAACACVSDCVCARVCGWHLYCTHKTTIVWSVSERVVVSYVRHLKCSSDLCPAQNAFSIFISSAVQWTPHHNVLINLSVLCGTFLFPHLWCAPFDSNKSLHLALCKLMANQIPRISNYVLCSRRAADHFLFKFLSIEIE